MKFAIFRFDRKLHAEPVGEGGYFIIWIISTFYICGLRVYWGMGRKVRINVVDVHIDKTMMK